MTTKKTSDTAYQQKTEPWGPTQPFLQDLLKTGSTEVPKMTPEQMAAFGLLEGTAAGGNPFTADISQLAKDQFGTQSYSGDIAPLLTQLQSNLGDYASGKNLDFSSNPQVQAMLKTIGDDVTNRTNQLFAGAGRDLSGAHTQTLARGLAQGEAAPLFDLFKTEEGNHLAAAEALANAGMSGAQIKQALDTGAIATRTGALPTAQAAIQAGNYAPNSILNLEQQKQELPLGDLSQWAQLLLPIAGLGSSTSGTSHTTGTSTNPMDYLTAAGRVGGAGYSAGKALGLFL